MSGWLGGNNREVVEPIDPLFKCELCGSPQLRNDHVQECDCTHSFDRLQALVGAWGSVTFPEATVQSITEHMSDEIAELREASTVAERKLECADIALLLLHIASRDGFSLVDAMKLKFSICKTRHWGDPDTRGVVRHIESESKL